jgi:lipid-A-disaccharide synthase
LLDTLAAVPDRATARRGLNVPPDARMVGLLPGSRRQEIRRIFPIMARAANRLRAAHPALRVVASVSTDVPRSEYDAVLARADAGAVGDTLSLSDRPAAEIAAAADVLLVTSGTATLECALVGTPLAVLYRTSALTWFLGRRLVKIPRIALVNIVAGEDLAPEFLQDAARAEPIAEWAAALLADEPRRRELGAKLSALRAKLGEPGTADRAADALLRAMAPA